MPQESHLHKTQNRTFCQTDPVSDTLADTNSVTRFEWCMNGSTFPVVPKKVCTVLKIPPPPLCLPFAVCLTAIFAKLCQKKLNLGQTLFGSNVLFMCPQSPSLSLSAQILTSSTLTDAFLIGPAGQSLILTAAPCQFRSHPSIIRCQFHYCRIELKTETYYIFTEQTFRKGLVTLCGSIHLGLVISNG